jgi:hypothetical protein
MFRIRASASTATRTLLVAAVAAIPLLAMSPASATAVVSKAEFGSGTLKLEGSAIWNRPITVDGAVMATSDGGGTFKIAKSGYTPPADCTVDVNDGSARVTTVFLKGCTVTATTTSAALSPDRSELGPFPAGVPLATTILSFPGSIGPDSWQIVAGSLPAGLSLSVPTPTSRPLPNPPEQLTYAQIFGTPTTPGTSAVTFRATDINGLTATRTYTLTIAAGLPVAITPEPWPLLNAGTFTNLWIDGSGGVLPYSWAVTAGALPPGMTLIQDTTSGPSVRIGGTPTAAGSFTWTLQLTDSHGLTTSREFTATVGAELPAAP